MNPLPIGRLHVRYSRLRHSPRSSPSESIYNGSDRNAEAPAATEDANSDPSTFNRIMYWLVETAASRTHIPVYRPEKAKRLLSTRGLRGQHGESLQSFAARDTRRAADFQQVGREHERRRARCHAQFQHARQGCLSASHPIADVSGQAQRTATFGIEIRRSKRPVLGRKAEHGLEAQVSSTPTKARFPRRRQSTIA
jgi:hypothetical protein